MENTDLKAEAIKELQQFLEQSKNELVQEYLKKQIEILEKEPNEKETNQVEQKQEERKPIPQKDIINRANVKKLYQPITDYSWDQSSSSVTIYIMKKGIGQLDSKNIKVAFNTKSVSILIHDFQGSDYKLTIKNLTEEIIPDKSKFKKLRNRIEVILAKKGTPHWSSLKSTKPLFKPNQPEKTKDPSESLMDLMKQMYNEGDDEMKKTIAKAWTEF
ncbi:calcyclin-binding protein [Anaeramoeba ignava]|uniref:Calcyclin-binding protein n=1 Tax=Anaeramoeba ignava TaxID=1746090 RepID=A0A9Q0R7F5_ANAIG|nr:calcyclin-binding protein [Anaeramoeba ignava]